MIGVLCPSIFEYRALDAAALRKRGVKLARSGMGKLRALRACSELHRRHPELRHILLIGFAGGLTPGLKIGDRIEPYLFIEQDYFAEPFEKFPNRIRRAPFKKLLRDSSGVVMLTQDRFLTKNPYAGAHGKRPFKNIACDMESYAVAYYCREASIPYSVVKLISDSADANADHDFLKACRRLAPKLNHTVLEAVKRLRP